MSRSDEMSNEMNNSFGANKYLIIERQSQGDAICPFGPIQFDAATPPHLVYANGFWRVEAGFNAPYDSFTNLIGANPNLRGWVVNTGTGEVRYYPGGMAGDVDHKWDAPQRAIGRWQTFKYTEERKTIKDFSNGEMYASDIKGLHYDIDFTLEKVLIKKRKYTTQAYTDPRKNQFGFAGPGVLEVDNFNVEDNDWYFVILYREDEYVPPAGPDNEIACATIMPCVKFSKIDVEDKFDDLSRCTLYGHAVYAFTVPEDAPNIESYNPVASAP